MASAPRARRRIISRCARALDRPDDSPARSRPPRRARRGLAAARASASRASRPCAATPMRSTPSASCDCSRSSAIGATLGPREIGTAWHEVLQRVRRGLSVRRAAGTMRATGCWRWRARKLRAAAWPMPPFARSHWPRIEQRARLLPRLRARAARRSSSACWSRRTARWRSRWHGGRSFKLTARADRIDVLKGGGAMLIDYKTGAPPGHRARSKVGFAPQLTLEAAMLARGAFARCRRHARRAARSISSSAAPRAASSATLGVKDASFGEVVEAAFRRADRRCSSNSRDERHALSVAPVSEIRVAASATTTISPASRNGRRPAAPSDAEDAAMSARLADRGEIRRRRGRPGARLRPDGLGLGLGQRRLRQDPCARAARAAPAAGGRAARADPVPHLHQGGGGQHGRARVHDTLAQWTQPRRRGARRGDRRGGRRRARRRATSCFARRLFARTDRDARRPEDPDDPRLLRAAAASLSVRGQCRGGFRVVEEREAALLLERARAGALARDAARARRRRADSRGVAARGRAGRASTSCCARRWACARRSPRPSTFGRRSAGYGEALATRLGLAPARMSPAIENAHAGGPWRFRRAGSNIADASRGAAARRTASLASALREPCERAPARRRLAAYLHVFFTKNRRAARRRGPQYRSARRWRRASRASLARLQRRAGAAHRPARPAQGRAAPARSRGAARRSRGDPSPPMPAEGAARPPRFRRPDRAHARRC